MKPTTTNQEILLITSTFSSREFSTRGRYNNRPSIPSSTGELERAFWAELLFELLPELGPDTFTSSVHIEYPSYPVCRQAGIKP